MIFGECPYCDCPTAVLIADRCPAFSREKCNNGHEFWMLHSRIDPIAYQLEDIEVNEETKSVRIKEQSSGESSNEK